jgi:hypothetical protein
MAINSEFSTGQVLTAAATNALPFGIVGITTLATTFSTSSTSVVDITGLSLTFTAVANRRYFLALVASPSNTGANVSQIYISKGATQLAEGYQYVTTANVPQTVTIFAMDTPGAGSVTYKAQIVTGAGTETVYGTSTRASLAARLVVFDMGNT